MTSNSPHYTLLLLLSGNCIIFLYTQQRWMKGKYCKYTSFVFFWGCRVKIWGENVGTFPLTNEEMKWVESDIEIKLQRMNDRRRLNGNSLQASRKKKENFPFAHNDPQKLYKLSSLSLTHAHKQTLVRGGRIFFRFAPRG